MELKRFKQISDKILREYGFIRKGSVYYLILSDIIIKIRMRSWRGVKSWDYQVGIQALHSGDTPIEGRTNTITEIHLVHSKNLQGYHKYEILFEEYTEEYYTNLFTRMIRNEFDGYKECGIEYLKDNCFYYLHLTEEARKYLGTTEHGDFIEEFLSVLDSLIICKDTEYSNYYKRNGEIEYIIYIKFHCIRIIWNQDLGIYRIEVERSENDEIHVICITKCSKYRQKVAEYIESQNLDFNSLRNHVSYLAKTLNEYINIKKNICVEYTIDLDVDGIPIQYL